MKFKILKGKFSSVNKEVRRSKTVQHFRKKPNFKLKRSKSRQRRILKRKNKLAKRKKSNHNFSFFQAKQIKL